MWDFLQENNHTGSVGLPVVSIDGVLKIRPSVSDVHAVRAGNGGKPNPKEEPTESGKSGNTPIVAANPAKVRSL